MVANGVPKGFLESGRDGRAFRSNLDSVDFLEVFGEVDVVTTEVLPTLFSHRLCKRGELGADDLLLFESRGELGADNFCLGRRGELGADDLVLAKRGELGADVRNLVLGVGDLEVLGGSGTCFVLVPLLFATSLVFFVEPFADPLSVIAGAIFNFPQRRGNTRAAIQDTKSAKNKATT